MAENSIPTLELPADFVLHNQADPNWLGALPELLKQVAERWLLTVDDCFPEIRLNYVAPATQADGTRRVLKLSRYLDDTRQEIDALRLWDGVGAARLIQSDPDVGALLVERVEPGSTLVDVSDLDDDAATLVAAGVLRSLWRPVPIHNDLRSLESWCDAYHRNREALSHGASGFPSDLFQRADASRHDLLASTDAPSVLHGDMHHYNVLRGGRAPWLAIDPKGLTGDRCFDVCQFFRNPRDVPRAVNTRRLDVFCAELGLDRARTKAWCLVHAMLDACWDFEDGNPWQRAVDYALETQTF